MRRGASEEEEGGSKREWCARGRLRVVELWEGVEWVRGVVVGWEERWRRASAEWRGTVEVVVVVLPAKV